MKNTIKFLLLLVVLFCLNPAQSQYMRKGNIPGKNTSRIPIPDGPEVFGVFDGRSPCQELAELLQVKTIPECIKIKWRVTLFQDAVTKLPTTYKMEGFVYRDPPRTGKWSVLPDKLVNNSMKIFQLDPDKPEISIFLLKADENVLYFLDRKHNLMVGNSDFSYALYRTQNLP